MLKPGDILKDRYKVVSTIGEGGMSIVYLVKDTVLESHWAMKETSDIFPDRDKTEIIEQFKKEAKILANLSHPNLPKVIDYFIDNGKHYLVEEFIEGETAEEVLKESSSFDEVRILRWAIQICDVLQFLHSNSIIYRDLKPGNVMIDKDEKIYLVDFGIARFFQGGKQRDTVIIGTPGFASPEHYGRGETDHRSDVYSLGATLHFMMTGADPADHPFHFEIPYFVNPAVSVHTSSIIMKCLELDPVRRYPTAEAVRAAIETQALPALKRRTQPLASPARLVEPQKYKNRSDFIGKTAQFLSYTSIFPATMGLSGLLALGVSVIEPVSGFLAGAISFPVLCIEFWKRLDKVYTDQEALVRVDSEGITYQSRQLHLDSRWSEVLELRVIKVPGRLRLVEIKGVRVKTRSGEFSFDTSYNDYRQLIDTIVTHSGLALEEDTQYLAVYRKI